ncbi:MAG: hypothetical protein HRT88_19895, partial [Lentisphaeraceae bacterium]|nr:hypothetical protein [Lentisphaeraceae bacterium]
MKTVTLIKAISTLLSFFICSSAAGQLSYPPSHPTSTAYSQNSRVEPTTSTSGRAPGVASSTKRWMKKLVDHAKGRWSPKLRMYYMSQVRKEMLAQLKKSNR